MLVLLLSTLYAAPNLFGEQPAVQITQSSGDPPGAGFDARIDGLLQEAGLVPAASGLENGQWVVRLESEDDQLQANDALKRGLGNQYVVALNLAPQTPAWLRSLGARPMALGLDLRGELVFVVLLLDLELLALLLLGCCLSA